MGRKSKLLMPEAVKVGGLLYEIVFPYDFDVANDRFYGLHCYQETLIKINGTIEGIPRPWSKIHQTLIHELFHAIDYVWLGGVLDHDQIEQLALGWYQVLADNDIKANNFKHIPKKLKVAGYVYDIIYPYDFSDMDVVTWSAVFHGQLKMYLAGTGNGSRIPNRFIKNSFIYMVTTAISQVYLANKIRDYDIEPGTEYSDGPPIQLLSAVAAAMFQVLTDNPIEECIKNGLKEK